MKINNADGVLVASPVEGKPVAQGGSYAEWEGKSLALENRFGNLVPKWVDPVSEVLWTSHGGSGFASAPRMRYDPTVYHRITFMLWSGDRVSCRIEGTAKLWGTHFTHGDVGQVGNQLQPGAANTYWNLMAHPGGDGDAIFVEALPITAGKWVWAVTGMQKDGSWGVTYTLLCRSDYWDFNTQGRGAHSYIAIGYRR
jgi:hypothetical protein